MVLPWAEVHRMVMSRLAKRRWEKTTPEERSANAKKVVSARKWRPVKKAIDDSKESGLGKPKKTD